MKKVRIAYITTQQSKDVAPLVTAFGEILNREGNVAEICLRSGDDLSESKLLEELIDFASSSHIVIFSLMGGKKSLPCFDELIKRLSEKGVPIFAQSGSADHLSELRDVSTVKDDVYKTVSQYISYGGKDNFRNLILYLANRFAGANYEVHDPKRPVWEGIYHPEFDRVPSLDEYMERRCKDGRPTVGIWFYHSFWQAGNTAFIDELIKEVERAGANAIPVFMYSLKDADLGTRGAEWVIENYFMRNGKPIIDVLINPLMFSISMRSDCTEGISIFSRLGVPIIKAIITYNSLKDWLGSHSGLTPLDVTLSVAMPEFDGALITVPVAAKGKTERDPLTGVTVTRLEPIPERIRKLVRLSLNWARLRRKPNEEKRVAIILHNYPPRDDRIGTAFGLDTPASVLNIMRVLKDAGYRIDKIPESGDAMIRDIKRHLTNDNRLRSPADMESRAASSVSREQYMKWFCELPGSVRRRMEKSWGDPPGGIFVHRGNLLIPGIINGNIFIGLQPPRGFLENAAAIYHSPDLPIPHHYYAYYRWIRDVFRADLIMHIGKHGSLEWLPGKSVGLSDSCFPDIAISDLPNIYPYIINNPGEGTQAKRRSYCCIIDHLVPVMHKADLYDHLAELEVMLRDYRQAASEDPGKLESMRRFIWDKIVQSKLDRDLDIDEKSAQSDFDHLLERLHGYLNEIGDTQIRDGLHVLGEPPKGVRLDELLVSLTRLQNGAVPSMRETLAAIMGYDYNHLVDGRGRYFGTKTGGQILEEIDELSLRLVAKLRENGFDPECIRRAEDEILGRRDEKIEVILNYIIKLARKIASTEDELNNLLVASTGHYVPPGPSGAPTRGMADILPTGRNFYSVDPQAIPTPAAWRVGVAHADALLRRYIRDEGRYPEAIGMVIWGSSTMRTKGDDIAEALYLMGVRPVWDERNGRVQRLEIIPLEELKRPRIDVLIRISGLFRDAFPNIVRLIDQAVEMVASLDEPHDMNYLARHVAEDVKKKMDDGVDSELARIEACYRIFGCRPGAYGAGVCEAVDSKNWRDLKDLAEIYVTWSGYAYTRRAYGETVPDAFKRCLGRLELTVKNEDTREYDMLDSDDFYSYHGGMIAAVRAIRGEKPRSYCGDSSDPERVKLRSASEESKHIFRARILNPKWIESMKRHGYKGAGDLSRTVDVVFGWDASAEIIEDWMYEELANRYALDKEMQEWLKDVNPHALQNIVERLLEAIERGMWRSTERMREELRSIYLDVEGLLEE
ncbi:MAG: cobaltochelatase subunit CobN [Candidatus Methanosuratincola petrocarbonis]